jgi:heme-degrading monooxygenase HmoA
MFIRGMLIAAIALCTLAASTPSIAEESKPVLRHIVVFKFKETASEAEVKEIVEAFAALEDKIDTISGYEAGTNVSPEDKAKGFTHCFVVTFDSKEGLEAYIPHPAHKAFVKLLDGKLDDVFVFDYWAK